MKPRAAVRTTVTPQANAGAAKQRLTEGQRKNLATAAMAAVLKSIAEAKKPQPGIRHPLVKSFGAGLGMSLGVIVTEALAAVPAWNARLLDAHGQPVRHVEGADRIGNYDLRKRHQEVVGPKVTALVAKLEPGVVHDLLAGLGQGATAAPGTSYRLEAAVVDKFTR